MLDPRRRFSRRERIALYLAAEGHCMRCGVALERGWHSDHVDPHSRGGVTDVINGQALCQPCNLRKGSRLSELREWQKTALGDMGSWSPSRDLGFLVEATPGAGKTRFAVEVARRMFARGSISRVIVVVPTCHLEYQWHHAFASEGITVNPQWHAGFGVLASDEQGCAVTYSEVAHSPASFRMLCSRLDTLVILDEVHHCADERAWGDALREAFTPAKVKLLLSGTPFRSDNNEIPFVNYVDGTGAPDFRYGYREALYDRTVRAVFFPRRGGTMEWAYGTELRTHTFEDELRPEDASRRLKTAISATGEWLSSVLKDANNRLTVLRETDSSAGAIVFCERSDAARAVCEMLEAIGEKPVLAISKEADSSDRIQKFRDSTDRWIVSIRQISEGVDIPRLRVGVYATHWVTELFFRQVVGRLVRVRDDEDDQTAHLFIPDDPRLRRMASEIIETRDHVLSKQREQVTRKGGPDDAPGDDWQMSLFLPVSSTSDDQGTIVLGDSITPSEMAEARRIRDIAPGAGNVAIESVASLLKTAGLFRGGSDPAPPAVVPVESKTIARKGDLRAANNSVVPQIQSRYGLEYAAVNGSLNRAVGAKGIRTCTEVQLERRLGLAQRWLETGVSPE